MERAIRKQTLLLVLLWHRYTSLKKQIYIDGRKKAKLVNLALTALTLRK